MSRYYGIPEPYYLSICKTLKLHNVAVINHRTIPTGAKENIWICRNQVQSDIRPLRQVIGSVPISLAASGILWAILGADGKVYVHPLKFPDRALSLEFTVLNKLQITFESGRVITVTLGAVADLNLSASRIVDIPA